MSDAKESETKIVKNLEEKTQTIAKLQEEAIKKAEAIVMPNKSVHSSTDFDETWNENDWEQVKSKNKTSKEKPLTYANVASNNIHDIKEPYITAGMQSPSKNSNHIMLLNPPEKGPKLNNAQFLSKKVIIKRALDEIEPRIQVNNITTTQHGGILIAFPSMDAITKAKEKLDSQKIELKLQVTIPVKFQPKIMIEGIECSIPDNQLINVIIENNKHIADEMKSANSKFEFVFSNQSSHNFK